MLRLTLVTRGQKFKLRHDSDVFNGWDNTRNAPWTSVAVGGTNSLVKLVLPDNGEKLDLELVVAPGFESYISIANNTISGKETNFDINGLSATTSLSGHSYAKIFVRQKSLPSNICATLYVHVFAQQIIYFDLCYASDSQNAASALPSNLPTANQIATELNATFSPQVNVKFVARNTFTLNSCRGAFSADGTLPYTTPTSQQTQAWEYISNASFGDDTETTIYRIFIVKKIHDTAIGYTPTSARNYAFINSDADLRTYAHEAGRAFKLSTEHAGNGNFDLGPWPEEFKTDGLSDLQQRGLMNDNTGTQERWIRQEDCEESNLNAGQDPFK